MQMFGQNVAVLIAGLVGLALARFLDDAALAAWGWRIAMALGVGVVPIGLILRRTLPETLPADPAAVAPPLSSYRRTAIIAFLALLSGTIMTYVTNFLTTFAKTTLALPSNVAFWATVAVGIGGTIGAPLGGWLADRYGRRRIMILPTLLVCLLTLPAFWLLTVMPGKASLFVVGCGLRLAIGIALSAVLVHITEDFPVRVRSGALSIVYALAISIFGGSTQFVVAWLTGVTGSPLAPAWYMAAAAAIGVVALWFARETAPSKS
ncbi:MAG TPA: MFS transporter, partial [Sphingomonas sp.]